MPALFAESLVVAIVTDQAMAIVTDRAMITRAFSCFIVGLAGLALALAAPQEPPGKTAPAATPPADARAVTRPADARIATRPVETQPVASPATTRTAGKPPAALAPTTTAPSASASDAAPRATAPARLADRPAASTSAPAGLPLEWLGDWAGAAELVAPGRPSRPFRMELHIAPQTAAGQYTWTIVYGEGEQRQERPYVLRVKDAARGLYETDEQNSIVLPMVLIGDTFYECFEVEGVMLHVTHRLVGRGTPDARIEVEMASYSGEATATGGQEDAPPVKGRVPTTVQRATLRRME
jgi:hypothetical protein